LANLTEDYQRATFSSVPYNKYKEVLLACAIAASKTNNEFGISDASISGMVGRTTLGRLIVELCRPDRGTLIEKRAGRRCSYSFADPSMIEFIKSLGETAT
jgi:hypothetical protein